MKVSFHSPSPREPFGPILREVVNHAVEARIAVAYCSCPGVDELERVCSTIIGKPSGKSEKVKVTVGVRTPTDLDALCQFATRWPGVLHIHLGLKEPKEKSDAGHFHSKLVAFRRKDGSSTIFVGSHNWTQLALKGRNWEASVRVDCESEDPFAKDARLHARKCWEESEAFDPARLPMYKQIQHHLSWKAAGAGEESEGYSPLRTLVLHAEGDSLPEDTKIQLYLDVREGADQLDRSVRRALVLDAPFRLHLWPNGALKAGARPSGVANLFVGKVTMVNDGADAIVTGRHVTAGIMPLGTTVPRAGLVTSVPRTRQGTLQVVAAIHWKETTKVPEYTSGKRRLQFMLETTTAPTPRRAGDDKWLSAASLDGNVVFEERFTGVRVELDPADPFPSGGDRAAAERQRLQEKFPSFSVGVQSPQKPPVPWHTEWFYSVTHVRDDGT